MKYVLCFLNKAMRIFSHEHNQYGSFKESVDHKFNMHFKNKYLFHEKEFQMSNLEMMHY